MAESVQGKPGLIQYAPGEMIYKEGEPGGDLLIIETGTAEVFKTRAGKELVLAKVSTGEIIGVMTVFGNSSGRMASVRAKTGVVVKRIPKEKVKKLVDNIPKWANVLINDLLLRVKQADELFVQTKLATEGHGQLGANLLLAMQMAEGFRPVAEMLAAGDGVVLADNVMAKLAMILNRDVEELHEILAIFKEHELVPLGTKSGKSTCGVEDLEGLDFFVKTVKQAVKDNKLSDLTSALGMAERDLLREVVKFAVELGHDPSEKAVVSFKQVEAKLAKSNSQHELETHAFRTAEHLGVMTISKQAEENRVEFVPKELLLTVQVIETMHAIDEFEIPTAQLRGKRTLVY